jgi:hypothetical protein
MLVAVVATLPVARPVHAAPEAGATAAVPAMTKVTLIDPPADDRPGRGGTAHPLQLDAAAGLSRAVTCAGRRRLGGLRRHHFGGDRVSRQDGLATIRVIRRCPTAEPPPPDPAYRGRGRR